MKETFVIEKIVETQSSKGAGLRVELIPEKDVYSKNVKLVFFGDNCIQVLNNFYIPDKIGDIIELDFKVKNTQASLDDSEGEAAD